MTSFLDKLNLRPQERRLVVIAGIAVFIVLNLLLVLPHFGDLARLDQRRKDAAADLRAYKEELAKEADYQREYDRLRQLGEYVATDSQALDLAREVQSQAVKCNVGVQRWEPMRTTLARTNSFFEEATLTITVNTPEKELVDFLWALSGQGSLTRVRTLSLRRDPSQMKLAGEISFVKSFQRRPPPKSAAKTNSLQAVTAALRPPAKAATNAPKASPGVKATNLAPRVLTTTPKGATNAAAMSAAAQYAAAQAKAKPGGSSTNAVPGAAKGKGNNSTTNNPPNFIKRVLSKWF